MKGKSTGKRVQSQAELLDLQARCAEMHIKRGLSFRQIGRELGISHSTASKYATAAVRRSSSHLVSSTLDYVLGHLDDVLSTSTEIVHGDHADFSAKTNANGTRIRAAQELAKLMGLYAPVTSESTVTLQTPQDQELAQLIRDAKARSHEPITDSVPNE